MECQRKKRVLVLEDLDPAREALVHMVEECGPHLFVHDFADPSRALAWEEEPDRPVSGGHCIESRGAG